MHEDGAKRLNESPEPDYIYHLRRSNSMKFKLKTIESLSTSDSVDPYVYSNLVKLILTLPSKERTPQMIEKVIDWTKNLKFFQSLIDDHSEDLHSSVCQFLFYESLPSGSTVFKQGERGSKFYIILEGTVKIFKDTDGIIQELCTYTKGERFGERALKYGVPRDATVQCITDCEFCVLEKMQFKKIFDSFFDKKFNMLSEMMKTLPIFVGQSNTLIQKLGYLFRPKKYTKGNIVYKEGDSVSDVYFIQSGEFRLSRKPQELGGKKKGFNKTIKDKRKAIELASMTCYEMFGDEEIFGNLDYRINNCYCHSNEGILYIASKDAFLKNLIRNDEGYQVMKNRSRRKEEGRYAIYEKSMQIFQQKQFDAEPLPMLKKKKENSVHSPGVLSPRILLQADTKEDEKKANPNPSPSPSAIHKLFNSGNYEKFKQYFGRRREKNKRIVLSPVNFHTARLRVNGNMLPRQISSIITPKHAKSANILIAEGNSILTPMNRFIESRMNINEI